MGGTHRSQVKSQKPLLQARSPRRLRTGGEENGRRKTSEVTCSYSFALRDGFSSGFGDCECMILSSEVIFVQSEVIPCVQ